MFRVECHVVPAALNVPCGSTETKRVKECRCESDTFTPGLKVFGQSHFLCFVFFVSVTLNLKLDTFEKK